MAKMNRKDRAYNIGVVNEILPLYIVSSQLKIFTAEGIATEKVIAEKIAFIKGDWPLVNMWWPQTRNEKNAIATEENAIIL